MTDRRDVLRWLAAGAAFPALRRLASDEALALGARIHPRAGGAAAAAELKALDAMAARTLSAACERILPASDTPGATDAGVDRFIDLMLADWCSADEREAFLAGLRDLDARSRERCGRTFSECDAVDQAALLSALDEEASTARAGGHWFARLKELTLWGYFTSDVVATTVLRQSPFGPGRYEGCVPASARSVPSS